MNGRMMHKRTIGPVVFAGMLAALWMMSPPAKGQSDQAASAKARPKGAKGKSAKSGATPRMADGKVDFSGLWSPDRNFIYDISDALKPGDKLPTQPWAEKLARERMSKDDPKQTAFLPAFLGKRPIRGRSC